MSYNTKDHIIDVMKRIWGKHEIINYYKSYDIFIDHLTANLYLFDRFNSEQIEHTHGAIQNERLASNFYENPKWMHVIKFADAAPKPIEEPPPEPTEEELKRKADENKTAMAELKKKCGLYGPTLQSGKQDSDPADSPVMYGGMEFLDKDSPSSPMQSSFMSDKEDV